MKNSVHNLTVNLDFKILALIGELYNFDGSWEYLEQQKKQNLQQLREIATIRSVGASTRIEGVKMSDHEVSIFLNKIDITHVRDRDQEEVLGYFEVLNLIIDSYQDIPIRESSIQQLHNLLLKHCSKDTWHRGKYKQQDNAVEATLPDGSKQIIFRTTPVGFPTEEAMRSLLEWYHSDKTTPPLIKCAVFVYEFLSIHPFQDGNGRLSRLLTTLLLLKAGYKWIQYASFEHEIENQKIEYYKILRECQSNRPNEEVSSWLYFFLSALRNIQIQLKEKLTRYTKKINLSEREQVILETIANYEGLSSGEIATKTAIPLPTVKRYLSNLFEAKLLIRKGEGKLTKYYPLL